MRRLAALLSVAFLAGCACTNAGCDNRLRFNPGIDLQHQAAYAVEACIDGLCNEAVLEQVGNAWDTEGGLTLRADEDTLDLALGDGDFGGTHAVTFTVRDWLACRTRNVRWIDRAHQERAERRVLWADMLVGGYRPLAVEQAGLSDRCAGCAGGRCQAQVLPAS